MANEHDPRPPRDPRAPIEPTAAPGTHRDPYVPPETAASSRTDVRLDPEPRRSSVGTLAFIVGGLVVAVVVLYLFFGRSTAPDQSTPVTPPAATAPAEDTAPLATEPAPADDTAPVAPADDAAPAPADDPAPATEEPAPAD